MEVGVGTERVSNPASMGQGQEDYEHDEEPRPTSWSVLSLPGCRDGFPVP